jgi:hypothetical protein
MSKPSILTHKYDANSWENFTYSLDLKLGELFHEHGTFIGTDKQVIINEPTGDVAKCTKGDPAIISRLIADEIVTYTKQKKKLDQENISMIPVILTYISSGLRDRIESMVQSKDIMNNNDPFKLYKLIASVYLYNQDREHNFVTYHSATKTFANLKQSNETSYDHHVCQLHLSHFVQVFRYIIFI